ncbi:tyrosine-protein phosphatase [uncultured Gordonia sp.]|uniref:tyrosine-protein phosphatase n=2 Tax=uncultured Gordonia sp. TaxID=198437 RepID=UPI002588458B|nr:tyrosine-protein phosphatase [uncultured Gordonia sp.]
MTETHMSDTQAAQSAAPEGLLGFRPVARLRTGDGRRIAPGLLYRSGTVQFVDADGAVDLVARTGLRQIIDLRLDYEASTEGSGGFAGTDVAITHAPFAIRTPVAEGSAVAPMTAPDPLVGTYRGYLAATDVFARIIDALLADHGVPALVHCTLGKDRTGVAVGVLLDAVGVLRADICADYLAGADDLPLMVDRLSTMKSYGDAINVYPPQALRIDPATMLRFLAWLDIEHGGARSWLRSTGIAESRLDALGDRLLVSDGGPTTTQILRSAHLPISADAAWAIVGDVAGVHRWVPGLAATSVENDIRTVTFDDRSQAHEQIIAHDDVGRSYTYRYLDGPIPLDAYESTVTVGPDHDGTGSLVVWNATLQATPDVLTAVEGLYDAGMATLRNGVD